MAVHHRLRTSVLALAHLSFLGALFVAATPAHADDELGQRWDQQQAGWASHWVRRGNSNDFDYTSDPGPNGIVIRGVVTVNINGNQVTATRHNSSDNTNCDYTGTLAADRQHVSGNFSCNAVPSGTWSAVMFGVGPSLGHSWSQAQEGWASRWVRRGMSNVFDYTSVPGPRGVVITGVITVNIRGNQVTAARRNSSDGTNCDYTGTLAGDNVHITGTFTCGAAGGGNWNAQIQ